MPGTAVVVLCALVLVIGERMSHGCWQSERLPLLSYIVESYDTLLRNDALRDFFVNQRAPACDLCDIKYKVSKVARGTRQLLSQWT